MKNLFWFEWSAGAQTLCHNLDHFRPNLSYLQLCVNFLCTSQILELNSIQPQPSNISVPIKMLKHLRGIQ